VVRVSNRGFRELLAEHRHALLPPLLPDHRDSFDIGEVLNREFGVFPPNAGNPAS